MCVDCTSASADLRRQRKLSLSDLRELVSCDSHDLSDLRELVSCDSHDLSDLRETCSEHRVRSLRRGHRLGRSNGTPRVARRYRGRRSRVSPRGRASRRSRPRAGACRSLARSGAPWANGCAPRTITEMVASKSTFKRSFVRRDRVPAVVGVQANHVVLADAVTEEQLAAGHVDGDRAGERLQHLDRERRAAPSCGASSAACASRRRGSTGRDLPRTVVTRWRASVLHTRSTSP